MIEQDDVEDPQVAKLAGDVVDGASGDVSADAAHGNTTDLRLVREFAVLTRLAQVFRESERESSGARSQSANRGRSVAKANAAPLADRGVPTHFGPLRVGRQVGCGSFGRVFDAIDTRLERQVALKLLDTIPIDAASAVVPEARLLAQVRHENVVTVFGADHLDGRVGLWMEFVNGRTLRELCSEQDPLSASEALLIGLEVSRALAAVHRAGFVHCDIKAQNVMRQAGGRIVVTDFGAGRLIKFSVDNRPVTAAPLYAAPELFVGAAPSVRSDLYSLGVLLYFLVTGRYPVNGRTPGDIFVAHINQERQRLRDLRPDLPSSFIHVVDMATAIVPEDRPESAGGLEALLERATGRISTVAMSRSDVVSKASQSIAVLPFADFSTDHTLAHFCEGLAEEIIDALTGIPSLRVVPRTSAFTAEPRLRSAKRVSSMLNVRTVLQGSVRAVGSRLRVSARLTDAAAGVLWSQQFNREMADVFGVQEEIAGAICRELGVRLRTGAEQSTGSAVGPDSEAYALYLKGRYCLNRRTELTLQKSVTYLEAAVGKDPSYAPAQAALAEATATLGLYGVVAPHDIMPRARTAAHRAIELAGNSPSPHAAAACVAAVYDWDWSDAARSYHRAMEIDPRDPLAHHWYAINYLVPLRRFEEAAAELQRAADADPLSTPIRATFGMRSYFAHDFTRAEYEFRECLDIDAGAATARLFLGLTLAEIGRFPDAIAEIETAARVASSPETAAALAYACARAGDAARASALLGELLLQAEDRYVSGSLLAQVHAGLGNHELALDELERAADAHAADLAWVGVRPVFDRLRAETRFNAVLARIHPQT